MDYRQLLAKYMVHLSIVEGSTFLRYYEMSDIFTREEIKELEEIDKNRDAIINAQK